MAAGQGFKTFTTGEVLTAGDVNGYLMQGVLVFASAAARDAAITSPQEGQFAFTKDTNGLWYYDGAAWVASGATGDIEGVTAGVGISGGGTSGTVTVTNSMATAIDAKGDLVAGTGADTFAKLTVGANGTILTADSAEATGLKWATSANTFVGAQIYDSNATTSISNNTTTAITFNSEVLDTNAFHSTSSNTSRMTIPAGYAGKYMVVGSYIIQNAANGTRRLDIFKNGSTYARTQNFGNSSEQGFVSINTIMDLAVADYVELYVFQNSGGALNIYGGTAPQQGWFNITYLGA